MSVYDDRTRPSRGEHLAATGRRSAVRTYDDPDAPTEPQGPVGDAWGDAGDQGPPPPPPAAPPPTRGLPPGAGRALVILLALAALCGGGALAAAASGSALPGDALYPLKNTVESTRLALASGDAAKVRVRLERTENRAEELIALCSEGRTEQVPEAVFFFQTNLEEAMAAVGSLEARDPAQAGELEPDVQAALGRYNSLLAEAESACPEDVQASVRFATGHLQGLAGQPAGETATGPTLTPTAEGGTEPAETDEAPTGTAETPTETPELETPTATSTRAPTATEEEATPTPEPEETPTRAANTATARAAPTLEPSPTRAPASPTRPPPTFTPAPSPTQPRATATTVPPSPTSAPPTFTPVPPASPTTAPASPSTEPASPTAIPATATTPPTVAPSTNTVRLDDGAWIGGWKQAGTYGGRTATWIYGTSTENHTMQATFEIDGQPVGPASLSVEGMDSEDIARTTIRVSINGTPIYEGPNPLPDDDVPLETGTWATYTWEFDASLLVAGTNTITISNLEAGAFSLPPFFMLDYADVTYSAQ